MSASGTREDQTLCIDSGMNWFLAKPVKRESLIEVLGKALGGRNPKNDKEQEKTILDTEGLLNTLDGNREMLLSILNLFKNDMPQRITALDSALSSGRADDARKAFHFIYGGCLNIGAVEMAQITASALRLEKTSEAQAYLKFASKLKKAFIRFEKEMADV
jgi:HPt (histidine-containing phosphotransfer) domain-containing protein